MEGFLPLEWCIFWYLLAIPVLVWGTYRIRGLFREHPEKKLMVAVSGAFIFVLSSLKLPSVTGSSSHPTGTAISTVLYGVGVTAILSFIVLIFQALLLAHGGITTLGANVFSMGIAGPFVAYVIFRGMRRVGIGMPACIFAAAVISDLMTYVVTATQLALAFPTNGHFLPSFEVFMMVYAVTQIPLAILEGVLAVMFFGFLARSRPDLLDIGQRLKGERLSKKARYVVTALTAAVIVVAMAMVRIVGLEGSDDAGSNLIVQIDPHYVPWASSILQLSTEMEVVLFAVQTLIGLAIILYAWRVWRKKGSEDAAKSKKENRRTSERSPVLNWPPLGKLMLVVALLLASLLASNVAVPLVVLGIGLTLLLYSSRLQVPRVLLIALLDGIMVVAIGAVVIALVTAGTTAATLWIGTFGLVFTQQGISLATLVLVRAIAGITVMLFFAASTPIPHFAQALRQLRVPKELSELMILIYRYSFLVLEQMEKMMVAAHCRLGFRGWRNSLRTLSQVAVGMFIRSVEVAERSQVSLQCRNFRGDFPTYREPARMNLFWLILPIMAFVMLFTLNLLSKGI